MHVGNPAPAPVNGYGSESWYQDLFTVLRLDSEDPSVRPIIGIVTFNYDRSLKLFLDDTIKNKYTGAALAVAQRNLRLTRIVHVHGETRPILPTPYTVDAKTFDQVAEGASAIRLPCETDNDGSGNAARKLLSNASQVVFLGFGYDPANLKSIGLPNTRNECRIIGTRLKMDDAKVKEVSAFLGTNVALDTRQLEIGAYFRELAGN
jgi:hypothetical protein